MFSFFKKKKEEIVEQKKRENIEETDYADVTEIANYFKNETGVTFDRQTSILQNKVMTFCKHRDIYSFSALMSVLESDALTKQELTDYLTTNETFFYREFKQIQELVALVKKSHANVKILCAPSATGEEPYSIAIALLEDGVSPSKFEIVGIDINADALQKAKDARYKQRNVRLLSSQIINEYFDENDGVYTLKSSLKSLVTFKLANIFDASFANIGKFDYIFCRNMLIYFDKPTKLKAKQILEEMRQNKEQDVFFGHADLF